MTVYSCRDTLWEMIDAEASDVDLHALRLCLVSAKPSSPDPLREVQESLLEQAPEKPQEEETEMSKPGLSWWWAQHTMDDSIDDAMAHGVLPYVGTPGQEERYRRFLALVDECEAEYEAMKKLDPEIESDQGIGLSGERNDLDDMLCNYDATLNLQDHPGHRSRIKAGLPRKGRPRNKRRPKPRPELRLIRGGKG